VKPDPVVSASFLETESKRLWQQAIMGCNATIDMLGNYATVGVPGAPVSQMQRLVTKLQETIVTCKSQSEADGANAKQPAASPPLTNANPNGLLNHEQSSG
jgi:hypothetical protein